MARAADGRAPRGSHSARPGAAMPARSAGGGARAPMVAGSGHRHGVEAAERGEGKGEKRRRSTAHPRSTATTKKAAGAEEGGGAAWVDGDGGAPAVGELDEGVNGTATVRRSRRRRRRGGKRSGATTAADRSSAATAERESDVACSNPARRKGGERRKRTEEVRGGFK
uniref:Splicing coactivator subunit-like n=1 Tax=Oryza sativa subsp. japonica TaxID=39947 RepID=Q6Z0D8_ORYSJ|nr:splicing coactivator subunit-like [Oryza sativa Japonica Group]BAD03670.1 splicing coactivator subunit-like [Oryza sativa Japonica Group]